MALAIPRGVALFSVIVHLVYVHAQAKDGFLFTMPETLYAGKDSQFCMTLHGSRDDTDRPIRVTLLNKESGVEAVTLEDNFIVGDQKCVEFIAPDEGEYDLLLSGTNILHDRALVKVLNNRLVTLVQTDKPQYKPGHTVQFRVLTIMRDMKPRVGKITSIYILDPDGSRIKQYLDINTEGITSLDFKLGKEAKLGDWKIEVNIDQSEKTTTSFTVKEYVLPRFEVDVEPPKYILDTDETVSGKVCGKYTYGKPVLGYLTLDVCWTSRGGRPPLPCHHQVVELDGCYNFTVNLTDIKGPPSSYFYYVPEQLEIKAKITEQGTGAEVSYNHSGPGLTSSPLNIQLEDLTDGYFKPGLPYTGKVKVLKPDGTPAIGESILVTARNNDDDPAGFSKLFTTDIAGQIDYALCGVFNENTSSVFIKAEAINYPTTNQQHGPPGPPGMFGSPGRHGMYRASGHRTISQWFSPSFSYLQVESSQTTYTCGQQSVVDVMFTTRDNAVPDINYQVIAHGKVVRTGQLSQDVTTRRLPMAPPPVDQCLNRQNSVRDGPPADTPMSIMRFPIHEFDDTRPTSPDAFREPVVRTAHVSDEVLAVQVDLDIESIMSPEFTLLVYYVTPDGEIVADKKKFMVEPCFENMVTMKFNKSQVLPGQNVAVELGAAPGSVCGVGVVDKSVNILGGDHQITPAKVLEEIEKLSVHPTSYRSDATYCEDRINALQGDNPGERDDESFWHYSSPYADASDAFLGSGLLVLTNLDLDTRPCERDRPIYYAAVDRVTNRGGPPPVASTVRTNFPETWLWQLHTVGPTGTSQLTETAPHTVTTWNGNAMCLSQDKGLGLSEMTTLTTFQPFFLSIHMPYSAIRTERLTVLATVYNYLDKCIVVNVKLDLDKTVKVNHRQYKEPVCVCSGQSVTAKFHVTPKEIGNFPVVATATIVAGRCKESVDVDLDYVGVSDEVHRKLLVKAEGVEQSYTHSSYLCPKDGPLRESVRLLLPDKNSMVRKSARGEVQVIGDIMGPALSNLDHLVRMPTGCGEQNMVGFVPNILVMDYLTSIGELTEAVEKQAKTNMQAGYQRELNYRHKDGSFSAFGEKNGNSGSVWLTAFVVKSFAQAKQYIFIDEADLEKSSEFLRRSQLETGCYRETGKVLSSYMMGGLDKRGKPKKDSHAALTAYVVISLLRAGVNTSSPSIQNGVECMNREFHRDIETIDAYTTALVAYANVMLDRDSQHSQIALDKLEAKATTSGNSMYWTREIKQPPTTSTWHYTAAPSAEVEMTAYALMAKLIYHKDDTVEKTHNIAMWLTRQRNAQGGFASTQDTVVGLDALSQFAAYAYTAEPTQLQVDLRAIHYSTAKVEEKTFSVSDRDGTKFLLQSMPVTNPSGMLNITIQGKGCALVQANVKYNMRPRAYLAGSRPKFYLSVKARRYRHDPDRCERRSIDISIGSRRSHNFNKGMGLLEMRMVTGWSPTADSLADLRSQSPRLGLERIEYDEDEGMLTLYFDEFTRKAKRFSIDLQQDRELTISRPKPAEVKVFEYYEKDVANIQVYRLKTTCGTKLSIPIHRSPGPGGDLNFPVQRRVELQPRVTFRSPGPEYQPCAGCPVCHTAQELPQNFESLICNATTVYKTISGRSGAMPLKIRNDIRRTVWQRINKFAKPDMQNGCTCSLLSTQGGQKQVLIITSRAVSNKKLPLDCRSVVMETSRKIENIVRDAVKMCPL